MNFFLFIVLVYVSCQIKKCVRWDTVSGSISQTTRSVLKIGCGYVEYDGSAFYDLMESGYYGNNSQAISWYYTNQKIFSAIDSVCATTLGVSCDFGNDLFVLESKKSYNLKYFKNNYTMHWEVVDAGIIYETVKSRLCFACFLSLFR